MHRRARCALHSALMLASIALPVESVPVVPVFKFKTFPATLSSTEFGVPSPIMPFTIEGNFRITTEGAEGPILFFTDNVNPFTGVRIYVSGAGRLYFEVSDGTQTAAKTWSLQKKLNMKISKTYSFKATATSTGLQVFVDGLRGPRASETCPGRDADCNFDMSWSWSVGQNPASPSTLFVGEITDLTIRSMVAADDPVATAQDGQPDDTIVTVISPELEEGSGSSTAVMILIPVLIIILVGLIWGLIMMYCWRQKRAAQTAVLATVISTPVAQSPMQQPPPQAGQPPSTGRPSWKTQVAPPGSGVAPATIGSVPAKAPSSTSQLSDTEDLIEPPEWWTVKPQLGKQVLEPVSEDIRVKVQDLMNSTWRGTMTRDRAALGSGKAVKHFEVVQVNRNENTKIWQQYVQKRREIARTMKEDDLLTNVLTEGAEGMGQCEDGCNEYLLFHGSKPGAVSGICENDFLLKLAGSHRGTLYGPGLYFAESSSKADEYAEDDKDGIYRGLYAMLLCRVTLGKTYYTDAVRVDEKTLMDSCIGPSASYHSVLGDREKARGTYREFIVYATAQAYPEYVVIYRRTDAAPAES